MAEIIETTAVQACGDRALIGACQYLAVVAFPRDWSKRDRFMLALAREGLTQWKARHKIVRTPQSHAAVARSMPADEASEIVDRGLDLIAVRLELATAISWSTLTAGTVAVERENLQDGGVYHRSLRRVRASEARALAGAPACIGDVRVQFSAPARTRTLYRHKRDTTPVLHLAMALQPLLQPRGEAPPPRLIELIAAAPTWLPDTLERAERIREWLNLRGSTGAQIRLLPA